MSPDKLKKLQELLKLADDGLTRDEFVKSFEAVIKIVKDIKDTNTKEWNLIHDTIIKLSDKIRNDTSADLAEIKTQVNHAFVKERIDEMKSEHSSRMSAVDTKIASVKNGKDGSNGKNGINGRDGRHGNVITPSEVVDKLESLKGNDRLDVSAIKGINEMRTEIIGRIPRVVQTPAKSYQIHKVDLSAQCDGSKKTFSVGGSHVGIMGVFSTEFPQIYRPVIDYTETVNGFTLTSQVSAPQTGQTLVCQFLK